MQPVLYLVLFGPLLDGAIKQAGAGVSAYNWFVPGPAHPGRRCSGPPSAGSA